MTIYVRKLMPKPTDAYRRPTVEMEFTDFKGRNLNKIK